MNIFQSEIETLNGLPYTVDTDGSWVKENDIVKYLCNDDWYFYIKYFMEETYLNLKRNEDQFSLLHTLIAAHEVFEIVSDLKLKSDVEKYYEKNVWSFIVQLAKIGIKELDNDRPPLHVMEDMLRSKSQ